MKNIIKEICLKHGLEIKKKFSLGNMCDAVYKVRDKNGKDLVLKVGTNKTAINEIAINQAGYRKMRELGLSNFIPKIVKIEISDELSFIIMEYCGIDLLTRLKQHQTSMPIISLFSQLTAELEKLYEISKQKSVEGQSYLQAIIAVINEQYKDFLLERMDHDGKLAVKIETISSSIDYTKLKYVCFSNWDFTPDDVYLTDDGLKYSDPHENVLGIPIIDMACFAGVTMAHNIPYAERGYKIIEEFTTTKISSIISIPNELAERLFYLGRVLQCFLSARFRMDSHPEYAKKIFLEGKMYIEKIT